MTTEKNNQKSYFGTETETLERVVNGKKVSVAWDWSSFLSTEGFPIDDNLISWVIGQDRALQECFLCLDEWAHKLKWLETQKWYEEWREPSKPKPSVKTKLSPGPYLLLLGDPGTGKSLLGRALAEKLTEAYKQQSIELFDVLCWKNKVVPAEPKISMHEAGRAKEVIKKERLRQEKRKFLLSMSLRTIQTMLMAFGLILLVIGMYGLYQLFLTWSTNPTIAEGLTLQQSYNYNFMDFFSRSFQSLVLVFVPAGSLLFFGIFIWWFGKLGGGTINLGGIGGAQQSGMPKL